MNRNDSPVWEIYNTLRTSKLNVKYYSYRMNAMEKANTLLEVLIAITAPGGAISALWFWGDPIGAVLWKTLLVVAAISSLIKPFLGMTDKIKRIQECLSGYRLIVFDINEIIGDMISIQEYNQEIREMYKAVVRKERELIGIDPESNHNRKLVHRFTDEVINEMKDYNFYIPEEKNA